MPGCRSLAAILATLLVAEMASAQEATPRVSEIKETQVQSVVVADRVVETADGKVSIRSIKINPRQNILQLVLPKNSESGGASLLRFKFDADNSLAVFTGGFLDTYSPVTPAGLVYHEKKIRNEPSSKDPVMKAVVCYSADERWPVTIIDAGAFSEGQAKGDCIQTGPFLVKGGEANIDLDAVDAALNFPFSRKAFDRAFILVDSHGDVVVGITSRISLFSLREVLRQSEQAKGFAAVTAVALSGTRTAGLVVDGEGNDTIAGNVKTLLPNAVIVKRR